MAYVPFDITWITNLIVPLIMLFLVIFIVMYLFKALRPA